MSYSSSRGLVPMVLAGVLWGTIGPAVAVLHDHGLSSVDASAWRAAIAGAGVAVYVALTARGRPAARHRPSARWFAGGLALGAATAGYQLAYFAAIPAAGVGLATLVALGLGPVLVALADAVHRRHRPSARLAAALVASLVGLALLVGGGGAGDDLAAGTAFAVLSAAGYAAVVLATGPASRALGTRRLSACTAAGAVLALAPVVAVAGLRAPSDPAALAAALHLGLVASALGYALYYVAARTLASTTVTFLALLEPVTAAALGWVLLGEALGAGGLVGGALLLGAVVVATR